MHDARGRARLAAETLDECGRVCQVRVHHFEGDGPVESLILGDVHGSHAAAGQPAGDPVSFVDQQADQRIGLVECSLVTHLVDSMGVFVKSAEVRASVRR